MIDGMWCDGAAELSWIGAETWLFNIRNVLMLLTCQTGGSDKPDDQR